MIKKNKSHLFIALTIVVILFIVTFTILLLISPTIFVDKINSNSSISVNFDFSQNIEIGENLPVSDKLGKTFSISGVEKGVFGYLEFDISNNEKADSKFQVYVTKEKNDNEIDGKYIKFYLTDEYDNPYGSFGENVLPSFFDLPTLSDKPSSRELYCGKIGANEQQRFKLRVWLSDDYVISNKGSIIKLNVDVRAI